jgi:hypothetical protein
LNSLTSSDAQRGYRHAIDEFNDSYFAHRGPLPMSSVPFADVTESGTPPFPASHFQGTASG